MTESTQPPPIGPEAGIPTPPPPMQPHRGATILVLGILGIAFCCILGIIAWLMGGNDLREMDAGRMDPTGRGMTNAGRICGIISVFWDILVAIIYAMLAGAIFRHLLVPR